MFALLICVRLIHTRQWPRRHINSGIPSSTRPKQRTHRLENWPTAQAILVISMEFLGRLLPTIACLVPVSEPVVVALMTGCMALAARVPSGLNSGKRDRAQSLEDAA
jgi:hypothetical protein